MTNILLAVFKSIYLVSTKRKSFDTPLALLGLEIIRGKPIVLLCLFFTCSIGFTQIQNKNKMTPKDALKLSNSYIEKASWYADIPHFNSDSAMFYADKALKILDPKEPLHQEKILQLQFKKMKRTNSVFSFTVQDSLAEIEWPKIKNLNHDNENNSLLYFEYLMYWSDIKLNKGDRAASINLFSQALEKIENIDKPNIKAKTALYKGLYYAKYGLPEEKKFSLKYLHNSLNYYEKTDRNKNLEELYMIYAELIYQHSGINQDSVYFYYDRVKSVLTNYKKPLAYIWYHAMYSYELIIQAEKDQGPTKTKKYQEAKENVLEAINIMETCNMETNTYYPYCFELLADIEIHNKNYTTALEYQKKAYTLYTNLNDQYRAPLTINVIGEIYKKMGDLTNALKYKELFYEESLKSEKEKNERSLRENELQLNLLTQEKSLSRKQSQQVLLLAVLGIGIIVLGLFYRNYRLKQTSNLKLGKANEELNIKNKQNELLLKEIHHRVKNNLELVKSLISLQSAQLEDSETKDAMIASQNRVQSMGIIHQKLYQGDNLGSVEMKDYFLNLGEGILDTFNAEDKVKIECAMDHLELDVDTAVPIGLIVNELLTNALKYAFPENTKGNIFISLSKENRETLTLKVADNGIGKTGGLTPKGTGFGSQLIKLLTQQLNGEMIEESVNGTSILFHFKLNRAA